MEALVRLQVGAHHEAQRAEAVVHGDENDVALRRQVLALHHPGAALKGAAVDEDHHRAFRLAFLCRHPHVQVEAVCTNKRELALGLKFSAFGKTALTIALCVGLRQQCGNQTKLVADILELGGILNAGPGTVWDGFLVPFCSG